MKKLEPDYMHKRKMLDVFFVSMFLLSVLMINVSKVEAAAPVSVEPSSQTVGEEGVLLPTSPFTIDITVQDVTDLDSWQIVLYYNSTILNTREDLIDIPTENIFKGKEYYPVGPYIEADSKGTYIIFGAYLMGMQPTFEGSGVLCQITFTGQAPGTSELNLGTPTAGDFATLLLNPSGDEIPISIVDGEVTVRGIAPTTKPSTITINVDPSTATIEENVIITGTIDPTRVGVDVTIHYRLSSGLGTPGTMPTQTDEYSRYEYTWTPEEAGEYKLYAYWPGDADYREARSNDATVTVEKWPSTITLNVYPTNVPVGSSVIINGTISTHKPTLPYEKVTISYRRAGGNNIEIATVYPDEDGVYTCTWTPTEGGSFELRADWPGDTHSQETSISNVKVEVGGESMGAYLYYIIAAIAIIAIATIGIYFIKIRKRH